MLLNKILHATPLTITFLVAVGAILWRFAIVLRLTHKSFNHEPNRI